jgi:hypothetical protein
MKGRINSLEKYSKLRIRLESLTIPEILKSNYENAKEKFPILAKLLQEEDLNIKKYAICNLRSLSEGEINFFEKCPINYTLENILPNVLNILLCYPDESMKYEASWIIINLINDDDRNIISKHFMNRNIMNSLDALLSNYDYDNTLIEHIIWLIGNLLTDEYVSAFIGDNNFFISNFEYWTSDLSRINKIYSSCIYWTLTNYVKNFNSKNIALLNGLMINTLNALKLVIDCKNEIILVDILIILNEFCSYAIFYEQLLSNNIVSTIMVCISQVNKYNELIYCIEILSLLLSSNNECQIEGIMNYPVLNKFIEIISKSVKKLDDGKIKSEIRDLIRKTCLAISNLVASDEKYNLDVLGREDLLNHLIYILDNTSNQGVTYEILYLFSNIFNSGNPAIKSEIIRRNYHLLFYKVLKREELNIKIKVHILEMIYEFLKYSEKCSNKINFIKHEMETEGVFDIIETMIYDNRSQVYEVAYKIWNNYYVEETYYDNTDDLF